MRFYSVSVIPQHAISGAIMKWRGRDVPAMTKWRWAAELLQMTSSFFQRNWNWLARKDNRGRVTTIAVAASAVIAAMTFMVLLLTPANEVRMSVSDFQDALERRVKEVRNDLATAHGEERIRLENENTEITRQLADVQSAYAERQELIGELEASLARLSTNVDDDGLADARAALEAGDLSKADALLAAIEARADVAVARAAEVAFRRGQIAATQIRWGEAAAHFDKAARLDPVYDHLKQAGGFARRSGRYETALRHLRDLLDITRREYGEGSPKTGTALGSFANLLTDMGRYEEAEPLYRRALEVGRETLDELHPDYAARLNNLANLLVNTGRYEEAEQLYRQALELGRVTLGEGHPDYAIRLNNLANLLVSTGRYEEAEPLYRRALEVGGMTLGEEHPEHATRLSNLATLLAATGRHGEAEPLFRQAVEIGRETLGERHPEYATRLNNLGSLLKDMRRHEEAKTLFRQALEISRETLGEGHPGYAIRLNNLAGVLATTGRFQEAETLYREALEVFRAALGDDHARTRRIAKNYARLLRARFPDSAALAQLRVEFGEDVGVP